MAKIYTRTGDTGQTSLWGGLRVSKGHPKVQAYGEVDELNSVLGMALASLSPIQDFDPVCRVLRQAQKELFALGALLATPPGRTAPKIDEGFDSKAASRLEGDIDRLTAELPALSRFILPGGTTPGAWLHLARTVCRRTERAVVALSESESLPEGVTVYLNRLSDYLFTAARWVNHQLSCPETAWQGLAKKP